LRRRPTDDEDGAAWQPTGAVLHVIGCRHTGPRFREGGLRVARRVPDGEQIATLVSIEHLLAHDVVLGEAPLHRVPVGDALTLVVDVGLHDEPLAGLELRGAVGTRLDHGQRHFMPHDHRLLLHVAARQARMVGASGNNLCVGKADAHGVMPDEDFIRPGLGHVDLDGLAVPPEVLDPGAIQRPQPVLGRARFLCTPVPGQFRIGVQPLIGHRCCSFVPARRARSATQSSVADGGTPRPAACECGAHSLH